MFEMISGQPAFVEPFIGLVNKEKFLIEREIAGQFIAPVGDVAAQLWFDVASFRIDLDDPDFIRLGCGTLLAGDKAADWRVF